MKKRTIKKILSQKKKKKMKKKQIFGKSWTKKRIRGYKKTPNIWREKKYEKKNVWEKRVWEKKMWQKSWTKTRKLVKDA